MPFVFSLGVTIRRYSIPSIFFLAELEKIKKSEAILVENDFKTRPLLFLLAFYMLAII